MSSWELIYLVGEKGNVWFEFSKPIFILSMSPFIKRFEFVFF